MRRRKGEKASSPGKKGSEMQGEDRAAAREVAAAELKVTENALLENPKSYSAWHHRLWIIRLRLLPLDEELQQVERSPPTFSLGCSGRLVTHHQVTCERMVSVVKLTLSYRDSHLLLICRSSTGTYHPVSVGFKPQIHLFSSIRKPFPLTSSNRRAMLETSCHEDS